ncbi:hypothetical protein PG985_006056 [Apiospora marii]|uniref:Uncharacterized protein n=1 Tax=Apiospora marii TaxID=335849 RepID=A0ABR1S6I9_9PEZI
MVAYSLLEATGILRVKVAGLQLFLLLGEVSLLDVVEGSGSYSGWLLGHFWSRVQGGWVGQGARSVRDIYGKPLGSAIIVKFRTDFLGDVKGSGLWELLVGANVNRIGICEGRGKVLVFIAKALRSYCHRDLRSSIASSVAVLL